MPRFGARKKRPNHTGRNCGEDSSYSLYQPVQVSLAILGWPKYSKNEGKTRRAEKSSGSEDILKATVFSRQNYL